MLKNPSHKIAKKALFCYSSVLFYSENINRVRQFTSPKYGNLKKKHQIYSTAICIDMFVRENSPNHPNHPKRTPKPAFPASNNLVSPNTPHQTPQHQIWASTRHFGAYRIFVKVLFNMLTLT